MPNGSRRMSRNGAFEKEREANREIVVISINTRVPSKWRFVDLETGDVWKWNGTTFKRSEGEISIKKRS